jgi:uncharacterized protein (DUF2141 family)
VRTALAAAAAVLLSTGGASAADLAVRVTGIQGGHGRIAVAIWDDPNGFPDFDAALAQHRLAARDGAVEVTFTGLHAGRYAVIAYHDEDADGDLDRFFGTFPTEGWGLSNGARPTGPPDFGPAAVSLPAAAPAIAVELTY